MDNGKLNSSSITHYDVLEGTTRTSAENSNYQHQSERATGTCLRSWTFPLELPMLVEKGEPAKRPRGHDGRVGKGPPGPKWYPEDEG